MKSFTGYRTLWHSLCSSQTEQRYRAQRRQSTPKGDRAKRRPSRFIMTVHPRELWWFELAFNGGRTKAFKAFWRYRKLFTDTEIMNALSKIIKGNPLR